MAAGARSSADVSADATAVDAVLLEEVIETSGGHSNVDLSGAGATSQLQLHDCIKGDVQDLQDLVRQYAHQVEPVLGHRLGDPVHGVPRL